MLTPEQHDRIVKSWHDNKEVMDMLKNAGESGENIQQCVDAQVAALTFGKLAFNTDHLHNFSDILIDDLIADLRAGLFDKDIAFCMGYV